MNEHDEAAAAFLASLNGPAEDAEAARGLVQAVAEEARARTELLRARASCWRALAVMGSLGGVAWSICGMVHVH